jgi:hypothetical protein
MLTTVNAKILAISLVKGRNHAHPVEELSWSGAVAFDPKRPSCGSATLVRH